MIDNSEQQPPPVPSTASEAPPSELASLWRRFGATVIDFLILASVMMPMMVLTGVISWNIDKEITIMEDMVLTVIGWLTFLVINGRLLAKHGQTVGMRMEKIRIVNMQDQLLPLPRVFLMRYVISWFILAIPYLGRAFWLANVLFIFRRDRRCLHDHIAGTKVVNVEEVVEQSH